MRVGGGGWGGGEWEGGGWKFLVTEFFFRKNNVPGVLKRITMFLGF